MFITRNGAHQEDVGLVVAVLAEIDPFGLFTDLVGPSILRSKGEAIGQHHDGTDLKRNLTAVSSDLLNAVLVWDLDAGLEHAVGKDRLGNFRLGQLLSEMAVGADDLAGGFTGTVVVLLSPEGVGPAGGRCEQKSQAENQRSDQEREVATHGTVREGVQAKFRRRRKTFRPTRACRPCGSRSLSTG